MRLGPGTHLKGRTLFGGIVKPEEVYCSLVIFCIRFTDPFLQFDYFSELVITQELVRMGTRGYGDGLLAGMVIG